MSFSDVLPETGFSPETQRFSLPNRRLPAVFSAGLRWIDCSLWEFCRQDGNFRGCSMTCGQNSATCRVNTFGMKYPVPYERRFRINFVDLPQQPRPSLKDRPNATQSTLLHSLVSLSILKPECCHNLSMNLHNRIPKPISSDPT